MLPPVNSLARFSRATPYLLDVARTGLGLQQGKQCISRQLPSRLKPGVPDQATIDELSSTLADTFAEFGPLKSTVDITISDALTRCFVLQRLPGVANAHEIEAVARDQLARVYGGGDTLNNAAHWAIQVDAMPFARQWPVVAIPQRLIDALVDVCTAHGHAIGKIQPRFVYAFNRQQETKGWRDHLFQRPRQVVHCLQTEESLTLGLRSFGQWLSMRTHPPLSASGVDLSRMIRRECRLLGIAPEDCSTQTLPTFTWQTDIQAR